MNITIDKEKCIGCGTCVALAANSFKMSEDAKAEFLPDSTDDQATIQMAIDSCPTQAIIME